ncbi:unnamed protein product [Rotaria socialis]
MPMKPQDSCSSSTMTLRCSANYVVIVKSASYGVARIAGSCAYTPGDCVADAMSAITCTTDAVFCNVFATRKRLPQCNDQFNDYLHVEFDCVPLSMDDPANEYNVCQNGTDITSDYGILKSPGYPTQFQTTTAECFRSIQVPRNKTIRLWLTDLYIGSLLGNCVNDHVYVVDSIQTYRHCSRVRYSYPYICSSTIIIQYFVKTQLSIYRGMRIFDLTSTVLSFSTFNCHHKSIDILRILQDKLKELHILHKTSPFNYKCIWIMDRTKRCDDNGTGALEPDDSNNDLNDSEQEVVDIEYMGNNNDTDSLSEYDDTEVNVAGNKSDDNDKLSETFDSLDEEQLLFDNGDNDTDDDEFMDDWTTYVIQSDCEIVREQNMILVVLKKCRGLISMIKRSTILTLYFDAQRKRFKKALNLCYYVKSHWNSTYCMINSFIILREIIENLFTTQQKRNLLEKRLKQLLLKKFLNYFDDENEQMELLLLHAYFDPAGFTALTEIERRSVEQTIKKSVADQASHSSISVANTLSSTTTTANSASKPNANRNVKRNAMDLFNESVGDIQYEDNRENESKRAAIINEFYHYRKYVIEFNERHKPDAGSAIVFWRTYDETFSILKGIAKKMLSTPATSVPSESCFSTSSALARKERARLSGKHLCSMKSPTIDHQQW